jgi:hypothetical protein
MTEEQTLSIYDKRRDCLERWHLGDPAAAYEMAKEIERLRDRLAKIANAPIPAGNVPAATLKAWAMPREGEFPYA